MKRTRGFTLIELLVVIAIIALLLSIVMPALNRAKMVAQKIMCANHVRQQCLGTLVYSDENDSYVPTSVGFVPPNGPIYGYWFWDVSFWCTNELSRYAGFDDNQIFTCPANKKRMPDDARWWQYSWLVALGEGPYPNKVAIRDERTLSVNEQKQYYRVLPYLYFFDKYDKSKDGGLSFYHPSSTAGLTAPRAMINGKPMHAFVIRRLSTLKAASAKPMIMDAVISNNNDYEFFGITAGGMDELSGGVLTDDTNHLSRQSMRPGYPKPEGGTVGYADGHADWRSTGTYLGGGRFDNFEHLYSHGMWFWW